MNEGKEIELTRLVQDETICLGGSNGRKYSGGIGEVQIYIMADNTIDYTLGHVGCPKTEWAIKALNRSTRFYKPTGSPQRI